MEDMALMIAWEKMWKNINKRELANSKTEVKKLKEKLKGMQHGNAPGQGHGSTITEYPDGRRVIVNQGYAKGTNNAQQPHTKTKKARKIPNIKKQMKDHQKYNERMRKKTEAAGGTWNDTEFKEKTK
jgi:hypothetical protein